MRGMQSNLPEQDVQEPGTVSTRDDESWSGEAAPALVPGMEMLEDILAMEFSDDEDNDGRANDIIDELQISIKPELSTEEAIAGIEAFEKRELEQALSEIPELVYSESQWDDFLWTEDNDSHLAALRLARYWKSRKFVFGEEFWLRPLTQNGSGALWPLDIELLRSGFFVTLVRPSGAGIVTLMDRSKLPVDAGDSMIRISFYLTAIYAKEIRKGYTTIHVETGAPSPPMSLSNRSFAIFNVALPVKLKHRKVFIVQSCFEMGREALIEFNMFRTQQVIRFANQVETNRIAGHSVRETLYHLQTRTGIERECLPLSVGGNYDYKMFGEWVKTRLLIESQQLSLLNRTRLSKSWIWPKNPSDKDSLNENNTGGCREMIPSTKRFFPTAERNNTTETSIKALTLTTQNVGPHILHHHVGPNQRIVQAPNQNTFIKTKGGLLLHSIDYREVNKVHGRSHF